MKKYIFLLFTGLSLSSVQSQDIKDALRYAQDDLNGTARFRAMSGAFGALGGDLSSLNVNPAGSAVFANNQMTLTLSSFNTKNKSNYFGTKTSEKDNSFDLNQAGAVFVFKNHHRNSNWKKFSVAMNYENTNNFNNSVFSAGTNPTNSIDNYFLGYADGIATDILENSRYEKLSHGTQQAFLGYQAYIINPTNTGSNNTQYVSNVPAGGNYFHENSIVSNGYNGKLSFNAATSYKDKLYLGINLNSHFTDFIQSSSFYEENDNANTNMIDLVNVTFDNDLYTYGTGFSFQLGAIAKVTNQVRLGLAYESPTWYHLSDELNQNIVTQIYDYNTSINPSLTSVNPDSNYTIIYTPYKLQTPSKVTGSFAYIFGKTGLISIDYAIKDYSNTKFKPTNDPYFRDENNYMASVLDKTSELRIGAEYKIKQLSLRGGYRYEQSPYKNTTTIGDLNGYSGGLGYNFGSTKVDLAYAYAQRNSQQGFFAQGLTDGAKIKTINNNLSLTLLFEL
jgi:long-subunit fatty acid transport protein